MVFTGIDLGGTNIKGGIFDGENVLVKDEITTGDLKAESVIKNIAALIKKMLEKTGLALDSIAAIGAGVPGMIDAENGIVIYNNNLGWLNVNFGKILQKELGKDIPVFVSNDANVAALGESEFGAAKEYSDSVMITLGTGVGGGVIINNKIFEGNMGAGAELGHMVIRMGGEKCTCGRKGCFESYCSATALIRQTVKAMKKHSNSQLWDLCGGNVDKVNGKTAFDAYYTDKTAKKVVDNYITYLAEGLCNLANIFRPQAIILGGGISKQGEMLVNLVRKKFDKRLYGTKLGPQVEIRIATLRNDAGFLGAAAYAMQRFRTCNN
jgi:glucokinase